MTDTWHGFARVLRSFLWFSPHGDLPQQSNPLADRARGYVFLFLSLASLIIAVAMVLRVYFQYWPRTLNWVISLGSFLTAFGLLALLFLRSSAGLTPSRPGEEFAPIKTEEGT